MENGEPKILDDLDKERIHGEPHPKFEVELRKGNIAVRGSVRSFQLVRCEHLEAILSGYPCIVLRGERRPEILAADCYFLLFFLAMTTLGKRHLMQRLHSPPVHKT